MLILLKEQGSSIADETNVLNSDELLNPGGTLRQSTGGRKVIQKKLMPSYSRAGL